MSCWQLKNNIEEIRKKLNGLVEQNESNITDEIVHVSQKLDILIKDYYSKMLDKKE